MSRLRQPIRAIREPFGTAGLIVAIVALVAAIGGTAFAASGALSGKQKKEVEKIAKKFQGTGPAGVAGANGKDGTAGAAGKDGANAPNGAPGAPGKGVVVSEAELTDCEELGGIIVEVKESGEPHEVCNGAQGGQGPEGSPWTNLGALPPGQTEKGTWSFEGATEASGEHILVPISFGIPLPAGIQEEEAHFQGQSGFSTPCPGSTVSPKALPGQFCAYTNVANNADSLVNATFLQVDPPSEAFGEPPRTGPAGALLQFAFSGAPGEIAHGYGSWAVTAELAE
jgi:hypothetical protein